jgi:hypothetical protein
MNVKLSQMKIVEKFICEFLKLQIHDASSIRDLHSSANFQKNVLVDKNDKNEKGSAGRMVEPKV